MLFLSFKRYSNIWQSAEKRTQPVLKSLVFFCSREGLSVGTFVCLGMLMACTTKPEDRANASPPGALADGSQLGDESSNKEHSKSKPSPASKASLGSTPPSGNSAQAPSQDSGPSLADDASDASKGPAGSPKASGSSVITNSEQNKVEAVGSGGAQARPNPKLLQEAQAKKSENRPSGPKTPHVPGDKEPAALHKRAKDTFGKHCRVERSCGPQLLGIDCNAAVDGPYYYVDRKTFAVVAHCGGNCMGGACTNCPPKAWTCAVY